MAVSVKVCGIRSAADAAACVQAGCRGLGFVFFRRSRRYIRPEQARRIAAAVPPGIEKVGVFVNAPAARVGRIARRCGLTMLQFHGEESAGYCARFKGYKVIKAFRLKDASALDEAAGYPVYGALFDTYDAGSHGGTGRSGKWRLLKGARLRQKVFLAGGLTPANVASRIAAVRPDWVDVSSGVESAPGKKDPLKIRTFIRAASRA